MAIRHRVHHYETRLRWSGSTAGGYAVYSRNHTVGAVAPPVDLALSADPGFRGDPERLNPELLLVMAASSCQLLEFLSLAARARIEVLDYEDAAEGTMNEAEEPVRINGIVLRPRIVVGPGTDVARIHALCDEAHHGCYIANSLKTEIRVEPEVIIRGEA